MRRQAATERTPGERLFERYLTEHAIPFSYQPSDLDKRKRPDYVLHMQNPLVICEGTDLWPGEIDKPVNAQLRANRVEYPGGISASHATGVLSGADIDKRIRSKIAAELMQLSPFRKRYPLVVVLHNAGAIAPLDDLTVQAALSGFLTPALNTDLSALIIVKTERAAGDRIARRTLRGLRKDEGRHRDLRRNREWPTRQELVRGIETLEAENRDWGGALDEEHPHVRVYHNSFASIPLPAGTFPPPHASHVRLVRDKRHPTSLVLQEMRVRQLRR